MNPRKLLAFGIVGTIGFGIEAALLSVLISIDWSPYPARLVSFPSAVTVTWLLNRRFAFSDRQTLGSGHETGSQYLRYLLVQTLGALVNVSVFALVVAAEVPMAKHPVVALAIGSAAGLLVNFAGSELWVFPKNRRKV